MTKNKENKKSFKMPSLTTQIVIGTVIGLVVGAVVGPQIAPIKVIGDVFLRLVLMSVPIIILGAVTEAVGSISPKELGKLGGKLVFWFLTSTLLAAAVGVFFAFLIKPGVGVTGIQLTTEIAGPDQTVVEIITNFFSDNIIDSLAEGNMMQVIIFALFLGVSTSKYVEKTGDDSLLEIVKTINATILGIITMVMKMAPYGVASLLAWVAGTMGLAVIIPLLKYLFALLVATTVVVIITIIVAAVIVKVNPFTLTKKLIPMGLVAATTTSSAMSLPIKMEHSRTKLGISDRISKLVNPLGMVLNSAGQALFLSMASIMLVQFFDLDMSFARIIQITLLSTLACMGTLAVPGGALVVFAGLMPSLGLPPEGIALIAGVDWFRGAITTVPNVTGDALIAMIIAKGEGEFSREIFDNELKEDDSL